MNSDNFIALATNDREVLAPAPSACGSTPAACDNGNEIITGKAMSSD